MKGKSSETTALVLRLPAELKEQLKKEAERNHRSLNAEILDRLRASIEERVSYRPAEYHAREGGRDEVYMLGEAQVAMLKVFNRMSVEKQLALISLFK